MAGRYSFFTIDKDHKRVLDFIQTHPGVSVTDIYDQLNLSQSRTSQILGDLKRLKLADYVKQGKFRLYSAINIDKFNNLKDYVEAEIETW